MSRSTAGAMLMLVFSLVLGVSAAASAVDSRPTSPPKADLDGNAIFDDLEHLLENGAATDEIDVLVRLAGPVTGPRVDALRRHSGDFRVRRSFTVVDAIAVTLTKQQIRALARSRDVVHIEEDSSVETANDSAQSSFGVTKARLDAPSLDGDGDGNASAYSPADVVVAVIDTGIHAGHLDLDGGKVIGWQDFVNGQPAPYDDNGHGTHVAAIAAGTGEGRSDRRYAGVAPAAALVGLKVLNSAGSGTLSAVAAALDWVVLNKDAYGIEVVNLSLSTTGCSAGDDTVSLAADAAVAAGIVVVAAAGNAGPGTCTVGSPAAAGGALTVGAMADLGVSGFKLASFSSRGPTLDGRQKPELVGPGVSITSAQSSTTTGYTSKSGTSMSAPFVAGVAALMLDANPGLSPAGVKSALTTTTQDWARGGDQRSPGTSGADVDYGAGRLDAYAALASIGAPLASPPAVPTHVFREGTLSGTGAFHDYLLEVTSTAFPIAATLILPTITGASASTPNFNLQLYSPLNTLVSSATTNRRQDDLGSTATAVGTWTLRVTSASGGGDYILDLSGGIAGVTLAPPDVTPPATPGTLAAAPGGTMVTLDWPDNAETDLAGYRVYRRNPDGTWPATPRATVAASAYTDSGLAGGTPYTYRVTAYDRSGNESGSSNEASATPYFVADYRPPAYTILSGTIYDNRGDVTRLHENDSKRVEITGVLSGTTYRSEIEVAASIAPEHRTAMQRLVVAYDGNASSSSAAVTLSVYRWTTAAWEVVDGPRTGVSSDRSVTWIASTTAAEYLSPSGEVRFRVTGTRSSSFRTRTDMVRFSVEY